MTTAFGLFYILGMIVTWITIIYINRNDYEFFSDLMFIALIGAVFSPAWPLVAIFYGAWKLWGETN